MAQARKSNRPMSWLLNVIAAASIIAIALMLSTKLPREATADESQFFTRSFTD